MAHTHTNNNKQTNNTKNQTKPNKQRKPNQNNKKNIFHFELAKYFLAWVFL